jgi:hypothetical protein
MLYFVFFILLFSGFIAATPKGGLEKEYIDELYMATSSMCVTGLYTMDVERLNTSDLVRNLMPLLCCVPKKMCSFHPISGQIRWL